MQEANRPNARLQIHRDLKGFAMSAAMGRPMIAAPLPDVETRRLRLRRFQQADLDALAAVFEKPQVWWFPYGRGFTRAETTMFLEAQIAEWDACDLGCWLATEKATDRVVGYVGISIPHFLPEVLPAVEVGWRFDPEVWGQGLATEGATAALDEAFGTLKLPRVCSAPQTINPPSSKVCERLGMTLERTVTLAATARREAVDADLYWITAETWAARRDRGTHSPHGPGRAAGASP